MSGERCLYGTHVSAPGTSRCECGKYGDDASDRAWHARTGHCGSCGQPDGYCMCRGRCGCSDQHPAGDGDLARYAVSTSDERGLW